MYDMFQSKFTCTPGSGDDAGLSPESSPSLEQILGLRELYTLYGGVSFNCGIYRILRLNDVRQWTERIVAAFPKFANSVVPFGYDWLGRFYCVDLKRIDGGQPLTLLFSHFSDEVFNIPRNVISFHNDTLVAQGDAVLEASLFSLFLRANDMSSLQRRECADLAVPMYLGGSFSVENMKATDLEVSWDLAGQLLGQTRRLKEGEKLKGVVIQKH